MAPNKGVDGDQPVAGLGAGVGAPSPFGGGVGSSVGAGEAPGACGVPHVETTVGETTVGATTVGVTTVGVTTVGATTVGVTTVGVTTVGVTTVGVTTVGVTTVGETTVGVTHADVFWASHWPSGASCIDELAGPSPKTRTPPTHSIILMASRCTQTSPSSILPRARHGRNPSEISDPVRL
jgi:hypothetical protein